ncbi:MAG: hypothetical protein LAO23_08180 [Acidobacteriia bacterium]|nr:hypothetical protein [Terriglobia bacterium]
MAATQAAMSGMGRICNVLHMGIAVEFLFAGAAREDARRTAAGRRSDLQW